MHQRMEGIKRIREKPVTKQETKDGKTVFAKHLIIYGKDLVTITLVSEDKASLEIQAYVEGEKNKQTK